MWVNQQIADLPRTSRSYSLNLINGSVFFIKPGNLQILTESSRKNVVSTSSMHKKFESFTPSLSGHSSLHIGIGSHYLCAHENREDSYIFFIPTPLTKVETDIVEHHLPPNTGIKLTRPYNKLSDVPNTKPDNTKVVRGAAISDNGSLIALSTGDSLWIWSQLMDQPRGYGHWVDISKDHRFAVHIPEPFPDPDENPNRPPPSFSLLPSRYPSARVTQSLAVFDNPDEGKGVVCLSALLPPSLPYDTVHLFVSICHIGETLSFSRSFTTVKTEAGETPRIWWSPCARIVTVATGNSFLILTRHLSLISVLPVSEIFDKQGKVSSVSWSKGGKFMLVTSDKGDIGAVSRDGQNLRHSICHLTSFGTNAGPLFVNSDNIDPTLFVVYGMRKWRKLRLEDIGTPSLVTLMSLGYPSGHVNTSFPLAAKLISNTDVKNPYSLVSLLYYSDIFRLFPYQSPLRYLIIQKSIEGSDYFLDSGNHLLAFFIVRCIFRLTGKMVPAYTKIIERLSVSKNDRDRRLLSILVDESEGGDYSLQRSSAPDSIKCYGDDKRVYDIPPNGREEDLNKAIRVIRRAFFSDDPDLQSEEKISSNPHLLVRLLVTQKRFDAALQVLRTHSLSMSPLTLLKESVSLFDDPVYILSSMTSTVKEDPESESELREIAGKALISLLHTKLSSLSPSCAFELRVPEKREDCEEISCLIAILGAAIGYPTLKMLSNIPGSYVFEFFKLVFYYEVSREAALDISQGKASDMVARLLAFDTFVNTEKIAKMISTSKRDVSEEIVALYVDGNRDVVMDPYYAEFVRKVLYRLSPTVLQRVISNIEAFAKSESVIPKSNILLATAVSHVIPWLRCGIPRAITGFKYNNGVSEFIPSELLDFEDFSLDLELDTVKTTPITLPPTENMPTHIESEVSQGYTSNAEYSSLADSESLRLPAETTSKRVKASSKKAKVRRKKVEPSDAYETESESYRMPMQSVRKKKKVPVKMPEEKRRRPLKPLFVGPPQPTYEMIHQFPQNFPLYDPIPQTVVETYYYPQTQDIQFGSIWDMNPSGFELPTNDSVPKPTMQTQPQPQTQLIRKDVMTEVHVVEKEEPKRNTKTKRIKKHRKPILLPPEPVVKTHFVEINHPVQPTKHIESDESSDISDFSLSDTVRRNNPPVNPFPLDEGLHEKVVRLLSESKFVDNQKPLTPKPRELRVETRPSKPDSGEIIRFSAQSRKIEQSFSEAFVQKEPTLPQTKPEPQVIERKPRVSNRPDFYPPVTQIKSSKVIGIREVHNSMKDKH